MAANRRPNEPESQGEAGLFVPSSFFRVGLYGSFQPTRAWLKYFGNMSYHVGSLQFQLDGFECSPLLMAP